MSFLIDEAREARRARVAALTGDSRIVVGKDAGALADAVSSLLEDDADRARRGAIGRERMGPPGAIDAVVAELTKDERR